MVDRETKAWDTQDAEVLISIFHPDMVWPWPRTSDSHDPLDWLFELGRYDYDRWKAAWQELFDTQTLVHNRRACIARKRLSTGATIKPLHLLCPGAGSPGLLAMALRLQRTTVWTTFFLP